MRIGSFETKNPIFLAPMAGVTDLAFRAICAEAGCGLTYTEMVSAKGLFFNMTQTKELLQTHPSEQPCAVQIFGSDPELMADMAVRIQDMYRGQIGIMDINMGCPTPKIVKNGDGCALMRDMPLAGRILKAVARALDIPVTVKIRLGWDKDTINHLAFARMAQDCGVGALELHARTREQLYSGKADWDAIRRTKEAISIPVIGNGDVFCAQDALAMMEQTGCDGVMIARGAQGNPWIFSQTLDLLAGKTPSEPTHDERIGTAARHARLAVETRGEKTAVPEMRKHLCWYLKGWHGAAGLKRRINAAATLAEMLEILEDAKQS
jgi:tRNA-dihydrouridine synthase B